MSRSHENLVLSSTFIMDGATIIAVDESGRRTLELIAETETIIDCKYKILALIGEGGMGAVYKAHHLLLQKDVALKTFRTRNLSTEVWQRFQQEAKAIARLKHKNIVEVFDFGVADSKIPYYTMSLLIGESLAQRLERFGHLQVIDALEIFLQIADALEHAHNHNIVHRDVKPGNIFLEQSGKDSGQPPHVKLVDFGIAKLAVGEQAAESQSLTEPGVIFGSPLYMSPEQINGCPIDQRSDIYSFGCALFETLTGEPPFTADSAMATMLCHINQDPPQLRDLMGDALPPRLDIVLMRLLSKNPDRRYQSLAEVKNDLRYCLAGAKKSGVVNVSDLSGDVDSSIDKKARTSGERARLNFLSVAALILLALVCKLYICPLLWPAPHPRAAAPSELITDLLPKAPAKESPTIIKGRADAIASKIPFLVKVDSQKALCQFPDYASIGSFSKAWGNNPIECQGKFEWMMTNRINFTTGDEIFKHPELALRFSKDDLSGIKFEEPIDADSNAKWSLAKLAYFQHLKRLDYVDLAKANLDRRAIPLLESLPHLRALKIGDTGINGIDLAQSVLMTRLTELDASNDKDMAPYFKKAVALGNRCTIRHLNVSGCGVNDLDLKNICRIKSLNVFTAKNARITGFGLSDAAHDSNITILTLDENPLSGEYVDAFDSFKKLAVLSIKGVSLPRDKMDEIVKICHKRKITLFL